MEKAKNMELSSKNLSSVYEKSDALSHYLSQTRRDAVKVHWEEPVSRSVFKQAIISKNTEHRGVLRVADIGSGTGDGYVLLSSLLAKQPELCERLDYLGVDISPAMIDTANKLYGTEKNVKFTCADIRSWQLDQPIDLYLSCGVPYSHLTTDELYKALQLIVASVQKQGMRCAVIIDVLGKYSIEWTPQWQHSRWNYCMSFIETKQEQAEMLMSFYSHHQLQQLMESAAQSQGCSIEKTAFFDRSIMVGRHTSTQQFNPHLSPYRDLINSLFDSEKVTDLAELIFLPPKGQAPKYILAFFQQFSGWWNTLVAQASQLLGEPLSITPVTLPIELQSFDKATAVKLSTITDQKQWRSQLEVLLAQALCTLEQTQQPGYGVGHDLFGVMWLDARPC